MCVCLCGLVYVSFLCVSVVCVRVCVLGVCCVCVRVCGVLCVSVVCLCTRARELAFFLVSFKAFFLNICETAVQEVLLFS